VLENILLQNAHSDGSLDFQVFDAELEGELFLAARWVDLALLADVGLITGSCALEDFSLTGGTTALIT